MRALQKKALALLVTAAAAVTFAQPASATTPIAASGSFFFTNPPTSVTLFRAPDGNTFLSLAFMGEPITGTFAGTFNEQITIVTHPDGSQNFIGDAQCICTIAGTSTGTLLFSFEGTGAVGAVSNAQFVLSGTGGLATFHGVGTAIVAANGSVGTYSAQYHFN